MRVLALALLLALVAPSVAQTPRGEGTYRPAEGKAVSWRIDPHHALLWGDARYAPVGARVDGTPAAIDAANAAGVKDLLIDLPVTGSEWRPAIAEAEKNGQRYLVRIASLSPGTPGIAVDPAAYRIAGLSGSKHLDLPLPETTEAFVVTALQRDGSVVSAATVPVKEGRLLYDTKVRPGLENVVLIYPKSDRLEIPDLWGRLDAHRDALLAQIQHARFGPGLRGIVDPLGQGTVLPEQSLRGVPTSPEFQSELAAVIERKHNTVENVMDAWSMSASSLSTVISGAGGKSVPTTTFYDLARLVPLWSGGRGVPLLWDPTTDRTYVCNRTKSRIWEDVEEAIAGTASRRLGRLCAAIRQVADVPVVQEWRGWAGVTEDRAPPFDGMAARVEGEGATERTDAAARAVSTVARWSTPGWLVATRVAAPADDLNGALADLANLGVGPAFVEADLKAVGLAAAARTASPPPDGATDPLFFPENAANPATVQRLPAGRWWLPTPGDGNRLDFGAAFSAYRIQTEKGNRTVIWTRTPGRYLLRMRRPEVVTVTTTDGTDSDPRKAKNGLTVTIGGSPLVIDGSEEIPIPEVALKETLDTFIRLSAIAENGHRVGTDETYAFTQAASSFEVNPGGSFFEMRDQLRRFADQLSPVAWVEAESPKSTTFSEVNAAVPGASADHALLLRVTLPSSDGFVAEYAVPVINREEVDLWVAARLTPETRRQLDASVGGVTLVASENPISPYGAGLAWYRLGTTRLTGGVSKVTLRMHSGVGSEAAIDAIVFAPLGWRPEGVAYPYELIK